MPGDEGPYLAMAVLCERVLILRGDHKSRTNAALAEVFGFLFGRAA